MPENSMQVLLTGVNGAGRSAFVSPQDYSLVMRHSWYYKDGYALANINNHEVRMHRYIMDVRDPNLIVDHRDRNRLNNTRQNLRIFNPIQNANNRCDNVRLECFGETKTIAEWSRDPRCCVSYNILRGRIRQGVETWAAILAPRE